jgi:hypothetical protein
MKMIFPGATSRRSVRPVGAEEVDEQLLLAHDPIFAAMHPKASELRIAPQPG